MNKYSCAYAIVALATPGLLTGCVGGGYPNSNLAGGMIAPVQPIANPVTAVEDVLLASATQNVMNGPIGSQISTVDQAFRLQQLGAAVQSGAAVNQAQQWVNPQTGTALAINPTGQSELNPQNQQQCRTLQEVITLPDGQSITENRQACLNAQTGKWSLTQ